MSGFPKPDVAKAGRREIRPHNSRRIARTSAGRGAVAWTPTRSPVDVHCSVHSTLATGTLHPCVT